MIQIKDKKNCVGCEACVQKCPQVCISFDKDEQGFAYPKVDLDLCIHCNLCEKVCPVINPFEEKTPANVYAAKNYDSVALKQSSSGGVFYALSTHIIRSGGVVFGARYDENWLIRHAFTECIYGLKLFLGSKYSQSRIGDSYVKVEEFLKANRKVLFSGTPCQIAGLKRFLVKDYGELLLTVEVICHGVPSPQIWGDFLVSKSKSVGCSLSDISSINFRDKRLGWTTYGLSIKYNKPYPQEVFETIRNNQYMQGFLRDLYLRPSCYSCPSKSGKGNSDLSLGDFWNVQKLEKDAFDENGVSLVLVNTDYGKKILDNLNLYISATTYDKAIISNRTIIDSAKVPQYYSYFWKTYKKYGIPAVEMTVKKARGSFLKRVFRHLFNKIKSCRK